MTKPFEPSAGRSEKRLQGSLQRYDLPAQADAPKILSSNVSVVKSRCVVKVLFLEVSCPSMHCKPQPTSAASAWVRSQIHSPLLPEPKAPVHQAFLRG